MNTLTELIPLETRFNTALKEIRKGGVKARRNVMGCCRSCSIGQDHVDDNTPFIEHFGGQGNRFMLQDNYAYYVTGTSDPINKLYFSHDGLVKNGQLTEHGLMVIDTFERNGIVIDWDRTNSMSIVILMLDSVEQRTPHEQALMVNDLMDKYGLTAEQLLDPNYSIQRANWHVYDKGISRYVFELRYTDEYIDTMAKHIADAVATIAEQQRERDERIKLADNQIAINERHKTAIDAKFAVEDVDRIVHWLSITYPQQEFTFIDALASVIDAEERVYKGTYDNQQAVVEDLERMVIHNLPNWVTIDYYDAVRELGNQYIIERPASVFYVWNRG